MPSKMDFNGNIYINNNKNARGCLALRRVEDWVRRDALWWFQSAYYYVCFSVEIYCYYIKERMVWDALILSSIKELLFKIRNHRYYIIYCMHVRTYITVYKISITWSIISKYFHFKINQLIKHLYGMLFMILLYNIRMCTYIIYKCIPGQLNYV